MYVLRRLITKGAPTAPSFSSRDGGRFASQQTAPPALNLKLALSWQQRHEHLNIAAGRLRTSVAERCELDSRKITECMDA